MRTATALSLLLLSLSLGACGDDGTPTCDCADDEVCADGGCVPASSTGVSATGTSAAGTSGAAGSGSGATTGAGPTTGCHLDCACYEPPYHPSEIDCATACARVSSICASDTSCWLCVYDHPLEECLQGCNGIAATWSQPNIATYLADVIYGCAMENTSCGEMRSCSEAITAQQERVCP